MATLSISDGLQSCICVLAWPFGYLLSVEASVEGYLAERADKKLYIRPT